MFFCCKGQRSDTTQDMLTRKALHRVALRVERSNSRPTTRPLTSVPLWIDNAEVHSAGEALQHPNTGLLVHESVSHASDESVDRAIRSSASALQLWQRSPVTERRRILLSAAQLLKQRGGDFKQAWSSEMTVSAGFAEFNVSKSIAMLEEIASLSSVAMEGSLPPTAQGEAGMTFVSREPLGVCLTMSPWNAALILSIRSIASALVAGNTVILKTSEQTPYTHYLWGKLFADAGLPKGALNIVHCGRTNSPRMAKLMIEDARVRHISFTGSTAVGKHIGRMAGEALKPCILELGGKAPVIILPGADIEKAANNVIFHAGLNSGQICMSTERVIVPASIKDKFVESIKRQIGKSRLESLYQPTSARKIHDLVDQAVRAGASVISTPGEGTTSTKQTLARGEHPFTILDEVNEAMEVWSEETFGPVCVIKTVDDGELDASALEEEMVRLANDSDYGLAASIYSADLGRALAIAKRLEYGLVRINSGTVADDPVVPFGGVKQSGFGRFNGVEGIRQFTYLKSTSFPLGGPSMLPLP